MEAKKNNRSQIMAKIRSKNTKPEILIRSFLFSKGYRFRINDRRYPGKPDIVLPKYKTCIFVNGCFWHVHQGCKFSSLPKTNTPYWEKKLINNTQRDEKNYDLLKNLGWDVIIVWECQLSKEELQTTLNRVLSEINRN